MVRNILRKEGSLKDRLKAASIYFLRKKGARKAWKRRHQTVFEKHPEYSQDCDQNMETEHARTWSVLDSKVSMDTFRICSNISGYSSPMILPEEIYQADIEPTLNNHSEAKFQCHKSFYSVWHDLNLFPREYLHAVDGDFFNSKLERIDIEEVRRIAFDASYPVVLKPNDDTRGGKGVFMIETSEKLIHCIEQEKNVVVQEKIRQHPRLSRYHPSSLNTVRVDLYKSVQDNRFRFLHAALRMGRGGSLDNLSSGGIISYINKEGRLNGFALDKYGQKFEYHPDSGLPFTDKIPDFESLKKVSLDVAENIFLLRTIGLDLCYDEKGKWRVIEVNPGNSIRFAQYAGRPFYREFTDEVIQYCKNNHWALNI